MFILSRIIFVSPKMRIAKIDKELGLFYEDYEYIN